MTWKLPGYAVEDLLGFGASGEVWRGRDVRTGKPVALKRVPIADRAQLQAARAEAALLSSLDHPHLVHLHELVPVADAVVLVLDLAEGASLADLLGQRGRLTPGEVITALAPIGAALAYAHNEGVVHGDVSAGNVLFTDLGLPLLADLGVARIIGDERPVRSTAAYIDPSVAKGYAPGPPSDVFSLAAVAVHALCGNPLWLGATAEEMIANAARSELDDLGIRLHEVPGGMREVLERALVLEPHLRSTAAEFALDLRHSDVPTPVELAAGRPRTEPSLATMSLSMSPTPALTEPDGVGAESAGSRRTSSFDRPSFDRPGVAPDNARSAAAAGGQLTHGVRLVAAQHRPVRPRPKPWRRRAKIATISVVLLMVAIAGGWLAVARPAAASHAQRSAAIAAGATAPDAAISDGAPAAVSADASPAQPLDDAQSTAAVLGALDDLRENAFARDDATLLAKVYLPGQLLDQDTAELARAVPPGCTLIGLHTTYANLHVSIGPAGGTTVLATATLAPSTLMCGGVASGAAAGRGPTPLRIDLAAVAGGYMIAAQQIVL